MITSIRRRASLLGTAAALTVALAACGGDDTAAENTAAENTAAENTAAEDTSVEDSASEMASDMEEDIEEMESDMESGMESESAAEGESALTLTPVGDACSQVPADGEGSSEGMADDPVATAASNNPLLSTLVSAVGAADLGDTLNGLEGATVFAPINPAFDAFSEEELDGLLADTDTLSQVLTLHVVPENLTLEDLRGTDTVTTVEGTELTVGFDGDAELPSVESPGATATVVCGDVQTANATVHLIETVLTP